MSSEIVPFGKYKGQPADRLLADRDYCSWLMAQPWFAQRFGSTYNFVVNYGAEPQDSPEHNAMQAWFLDHDVCLSLAHRLGLPTLSELHEHVGGDPGVAAYRDKFAGYSDLRQTERGPAIHDLGFEQQGWDVFFRAHLSVQTSATTKPVCACDCSDHSKCDHNPAPRERQVRPLPYSPQYGQQAPPPDAFELYTPPPRCEHTHHEVNGTRNAYNHCSPDCFYAQRARRDALETGAAEVSAYESFSVELKPSLGDDYPSVLRQVLKYPAFGTRCVLVASAEFRLVTLDQVRKIFGSQGFYLVIAEELVSAPESCRCTTCARSS